MYAVIRAGGKQYRVAPGDAIRVEQTNRQGWAGAIQQRPGGFGRCGQHCARGSGASVSGEVVEQAQRRWRQDPVFHSARAVQEAAGTPAGLYRGPHFTEIAFDGQSFKAPELPKKEKKVKQEHEGGEEVKTSARPGKRATKHAAHAKKAAPKKAVAKKKKK